jgi:hypothetical protein
VLQAHWLFKWKIPAAILSGGSFSFPGQTKPGGENMRKLKKELVWIQALRGNPIVSDPAPIVTDPNGSYTGLAEDPYEKPVQDADDL